MSKWERRGCGRGAVAERAKYWAASTTISWSMNGLATLFTVQMQKSCKYDVPTEDLILYHKNPLHFKYYKG